VTEKILEKTSKHGGYKIVVEDATVPGNVD
jgi:hypothetical protein